MRKLSTLLFLCAIGMPLNAATTVRVKTKLPEGVELHADVVKVKPGFAFQRAAPNQVYSYATSGASKGSVTGTYTCGCNQGNGSCSGSLTNGSFYCVASSGCSGCIMTMTVGKVSKPEIKPVH